MNIALREFRDIVINAQILTFQTGDPHKMRLDIADGSLLDIFLSVSDRYSYHWERRLIAAGTIYRHDNAPHNRWRFVATFPKHFHNRSEEKVTESYISNSPPIALRKILVLVRQTLVDEA